MVYTSSCVGADLLLCKNNYTHFIAVYVDKAILLPWARMHSGGYDMSMYVYIWSNLTVRKIATKAYPLLALKIYVTNLDLASHRLSTRSVFLLLQCGSQWCLNAHVFTALIIERLSHPPLTGMFENAGKAKPYMTAVHYWTHCTAQSADSAHRCVLWSSSSFHAKLRTFFVLVFTGGVLAWLCCPA